MRWAGFGTRWGLPRPQTSRWVGWSDGDRWLAVGTSFQPGLGRWADEVLLELLRKCFGEPSVHAETAAPALRRYSRHAAPAPRVPRPWPGPHLRPWGISVPASLSTSVEPIISARGRARAVTLLSD